MSPVSDQARPTIELTLEGVVDTHGPFVGRSLRYLGVDERDVPDACQEVFLVVHRRLAEFEGRAALETWLYKICVRVAWNQRRGVARRRERPVAEPPDEGTPASQERRVARLQARRLVNQALDELDDDKRAVFVLFEIEGLPMVEVAAVLECPLQTAYSRLHAARERVTKALRRATRVEREAS